MTKKERILTRKVNFYDGHRVTERDLDDEQLHNNALSSGIVRDFHGSGVVLDNPFEETILFDSRQPGEYSDSSLNASELTIKSGNYDGKGIYLDRQPSDTVNGSRLEFQVSDCSIGGRNKFKVMILGRAFNGVDNNGELSLEFLEFSENGAHVTSKYYTSVIAVFFNNFSGGTGKTYYEAQKESFNLSGSEGYIIVREAPPLKVYPATINYQQIESPNYDLATFVTSSTSKTIEDEISLAIGASNNIQDLYIELDGKEKIRFEKDGATTVSYGQKFLSRSNNLQKIELLLSVDRDEDLPLDNQFDFSGQIVIGIYELSSDVACPTDAVPDDLIDYDPETTPIVELSFGQEDLETLGYKLTDTPQPVSFNFSGTLIADPNVEPSLVPEKYYAFVVKRNGDNRVGTLVLEKGFDKVSKKSDEGIPLTILEQFGKQHSKYLQYDPTTKRYINDSNSSLWFKVFSDSLQVVDGTAYTDSGVAVTLPKTRDFVGTTKISRFEDFIDLRTVSEGSSNYLVLSEKQEFLDPGVHPRTNNFVFTRIIDSPEFSVVNDVELDSLESDSTPLILAKINDNNVRSAETISGSFDKPGQIISDKIIIINPSNTLLTSNLVNRIIIPDTDCDCNARYRIIKSECSLVKAGDLNSDGNLTSSDLTIMLSLVGNAINSAATERAIFGGEIELLDFIKADLNNDGSIDGTDIELLEQAVDGYIDFQIPEKINVLTLHLENILEDGDYPLIFEDTSSSGTTSAASSILEFSTTTENQALMIRPGDRVVIPEPASDAGTYLVETKEVGVNGLDVTLTLTGVNGEVVLFNGDSLLNITITSGTRVNLIADNPNLINVPYVAKNYSIDFVESPFEDKFLDICDLRRFVGTSFIEKESSGSCECKEETCVDGSVCQPVYKNQSYLPGDLYLPDGDILSAPGVPHRGDFEFSNIKIPLPPGSISNCSIDLYNNFMKSESGSCDTAAGFPAMKYSDGTLVGCEDVGSNTDLAKGRIKLSHSIASVYVDALVDGYADGYTELGEVLTTFDSFESISESFVDTTFSAFDGWTENAMNDGSITSISHPSGVNQIAIFSLTTSSNTGERYGRLDGPASIQNFSGDFIVDFKAVRSTWPESSLINGVVSTFATLVITNTDSTTATLKLGWKVIGGYTTKMFYSGVVEDGSSVVLSSFNYEIEAPDNVGEVVSFRFRRINDVVSAYYIIPGRIDETTLTSFGQYVRIGTNPDRQPGDGTVNMSFEINQENSPTVGLSFYSRLQEATVLSEYSSDNGLLSLPLARNSSNSEVDRITFTFPFNLPRRTSIVSAKLRLTSNSAVSTADSFNIIPINLLNADNLGSVYNVPLEDNVILMTTFVPGALSVGSVVEVDITSTFIYMLSQAGHLPGFYKGFVIEPDITANSSLSFDSSAEIEVIYEDESTGVVFKVGISLDPSTGIVTFNTKNILFDALVESNRTVVNFGVYLKKSGFRNNDLEITIDDVTRLGIGTCFDEQIAAEEEQCYFVVGSTAVGTFVEGPFPCSFSFP